MALLFAVLAGPAFGQPVGLQSYDYSNMGLTFSVPRSWNHAGTKITTKAAFIKEFGWHYDKPDADDVDGEW